MLLKTFIFRFIIEIFGKISYNFDARIELYAKDFHNWI